MSLQLLVILVPVVFGLMGFAFDLGRLYLIRGELNQAANAMALAAAQQLVGTSTSIDAATSAAAMTLEDSTGHANKYNFGMLAIDGATGLLSSNYTPAFFSTVADATGQNSSGGSVDQADGTTARHVQINIQSEAPLLFWSFLSLGQSRKTTVGAQAVAGISAPVCTACGIEPLAVAALTPGDTLDFGFTQGTQYTFYYNCTTAPGITLPQQLTTASGTTAPLVAYSVVDRYNDGSDGTTTADESQQLYRIGAAGLMPSNNLAMACISLTGTVNPATANGDTVTLWSVNASSLAPTRCNNNVSTGVSQMACGMDVRFENTPPDTCQSVTDVDTLATSFVQDTDLAAYDDYTSYTGNVRRVITVPIVDSLAPDTTTTMNVLGFRQFLIEPDSNGTLTSMTTDQNARFLALYLGGDITQGGNPVPLKQGRIDGCSSLTPLGPGKVVLHQ